MILKEANLETVCGITSVFPENSLPEIALAGKSNVGKSSLINCLVNRKALARTSSEPGKTQTINYYRINKAFYLVDLPGYGYAKVSEEVREKWGKMIERYLSASSALLSVFLLIDIRHEPSANDRMMYDWILEKGYRPVIILTKLDKLKNSQIRSCETQIRHSLGLTAQDTVIKFSARDRRGREEILDTIDAIIHPTAAI